jgi:hypothetical protein
MAEGSGEECRYFLNLSKDLGYGDSQKLSAALEEASRLVYAYRTAMLTSSTSGSWLPYPEGISRAKPLD